MAGDSSTLKLPPMAAGQKYGFLTAVRFVDRDANYNAKWLFLCDCGESVITCATDARRGHSHSCGCQDRIPKTHGMKNTTEYVIWTGMLDRCRNSKRDDFEWYGGRGITVCDRWHKFENFLEDMGLRPSKSHSIDRIEGSGNYEPGNVRWATAKEQAANMRSNRWVLYDGKRLTVAQAITLYAKVPAATVRTRLHNGWPIKDALEKPSGKR